MKENEKLTLHIYLFISDLITMPKACHHLHRRGLSYLAWMIFIFNISFQSHWGSSVSEQPVCISLWSAIKLSHERSIRRYRMDLSLLWSGKQIWVLMKRQERDLVCLQAEEKNNTEKYTLIKVWGIVSKKSGSNESEICWRENYEHLCSNSGWCSSAG